MRRCASSCALQRVGFAVDVAANGIDGEHLGAVEAFDAVVLDLGLPGEEACRC